MNLLRDRDKLTAIHASSSYNLLLFFLQTPIEQIHTQTHSLMSEMKKMNEAIHELHGSNGTSTNHTHTESLASDVKKLNQTVNDLARRNMVMESLLIKIAEKQKIPLSHI